MRCEVFSWFSTTPARPGRHVPHPCRTAEASAAAAVNWKTDSVDESGEEDFWCPKPLNPKPQILDVADQKLVLMTKSFSCQVFSLTFELQVLQTFQARGHCLALKGKWVCLSILPNCVCLCLPLPVLPASYGLLV